VRGPGRLRRARLRRARLRRARLRRARLRRAGETLLEPELGQAGPAPVGEQAHAVAAGHEVGEVIAEDLQGQVLVDALGDVERGHQVQDQAGDDAQDTEVDHGTVEPVVLAAQLDPVTLGGDQGQPGHGGGQVLLGGARTVGGGGAGAGHRDMRQRGQVAQREALPVQPAGQLRVAQPGRDPGHQGRRVDLDLRGQAGQADLGPRRIGQVVEGVAGGQHPEPARAGHSRLELAERGRAIQVSGAEGDVARPVRARPGRRSRARAFTRVHASSLAARGAPGERPQRSAPEFPPVPQRIAQTPAG
jgi:Pentapeptide repeats (8 copies)